MVDGQFTSTFKSYYSIIISLSEYIYIAIPLTSPGNAFLGTKAWHVHNRCNQRWSAMVVGKSSFFSMVSIVEPIVRTLLLSSRLLPLSLVSLRWLSESLGDLSHRVLVPFCVRTDASNGLNISYSHLNTGRSQLGSNTRAGPTRSIYLTISRIERRRTIRNNCACSKQVGGCWSVAGYGHAVRSSADLLSSTYLDPATAIAEIISGSSIASSIGPSHPLAEDLEPGEMVIPEMGRGKRKKTQTKRYIEQI
jgi:hypothetical protein